MKGQGEREWREKKEGGRGEGGRRIEQSGEKEEGRERQGGWKGTGKHEEKGKVQGRIKRKTEKKRRAEENEKRTSADRRRRKKRQKHKGAATPAPVPSVTHRRAESLDQVERVRSLRSNSAFFRRRHRRSYHVTSPKDFLKKKMLRTMLKSKNRDGPGR